MGVCGVCCAGVGQLGGAVWLLLCVCRSGVGWGLGVVVLCVSVGVDCGVGVGVLCSAGWLGTVDVGVGCVPVFALLVGAGGGAWGG